MSGEVAAAVLLTAVVVWHVWLADAKVLDAWPDARASLTLLLGG